MTSILERRAFMKFGLSGAAIAGGGSGERLAIERLPLDTAGLKTEVIVQGRHPHRCQKRLAISASTCCIVRPISSIKWRLSLDLCSRSQR